MYTLAHTLAQSLVYTLALTLAHTLAQLQVYSLAYTLRLMLAFTLSEYVPAYYGGRFASREYGSPRESTYA